MAEVLTELVAKITADATELKSGLGEAEKSVESWVKTNEKQFKAVGVALTGIGAAITGSLGMMTKAAIDEEVNIKRLGIALKNVGINYDDVKDSLEAVFTATMKKTGVADDAQRDALNQLLLVTGDYQKSLELLPLALDLAAAKGMDVSNAAMLLGRVVEGNVSILGRYGIQLDEGTDSATALAAIQEKVAGAAEATINPFNVLKASMGDMFEQIGSFLLPILTQLVNIIVPIIEKVQAWTEAHPELTKQLVILAGVVGVFAVVLGPILIMLPLLMTSFTLLMGPIGLVVLAIMALIAVGTLIVMNWDWIKTKASEIWTGISNFFVNVWGNIVGIFKRHWALILAILFPAVGLPILIAKNWGTITKIVGDIWDGVVGGVRTAWDNLVSFILSGVNWLIDRVNSVIDLINRIPGVNIGNVENVTTQSKLPGFASGGIVTQPTLAMIGEAGPEAVIPLNEAGGIGGITINFTQPVFFDREDQMNKFVDMIRKGIQRQDRLRFGGAYNG